jgi:hypothetical protein
VASSRRPPPILILAKTDVTERDDMQFHIPLPSDFAEEDVAVVLARAKKLVSRVVDVAENMLTSRKDEQEIAERKTKSEEIQDKFKEDDYEGAMRDLIVKYDVPVIQSPEQVRNICKNVLIEKALYGEDDKVQLKAVELLGKVKDIGLFEERSTVVVEHMDNETLAQKLREKIMRLRPNGPVEDAQIVPVRELKEITNDGEVK